MDVSGLLTQFGTAGIAGGAAVLVVGFFNMFTRLKTIKQEGDISSRDAIAARMIVLTNDADAMRREMALMNADHFMRINELQNAHSREIKAMQDKFTAEVRAMRAAHEKELRQTHAWLREEMSAFDILVSVLKNDPVSEKEMFREALESHSKRRKKMTSAALAEFGLKETGK